eukprot:TRINITY_DN21119_c0_g2_i1.p1 TRINITY_DN21119_c0_g2~~TRINITY_DN21119_c0_g2_i1.p1  ORF type:complete len:200 (+),score=21.74 TRINITY_DN21119_c0_g2_i1:206-805(+)
MSIGLVFDAIADGVSSEVASTCDDGTECSSFAASTSSSTEWGSDEEDKHEFDSTSSDLRAASAQGNGYPVRWSVCASLHTQGLGVTYEDYVGSCTAHLQSASADTRLVVTKEFSDSSEDYMDSGDDDASTDSCIFGPPASRETAYDLGYGLDVAKPSLMKFSFPHPFNSEQSNGKQGWRRVCGNLSCDQRSGLSTRVSL